MLKNLSQKTLNFTFTLALSAVLLGGVHTKSGWAMNDAQDNQQRPSAGIPVLPGTEETIQESIVFNWLGRLNDSITVYHNADEKRTRLPFASEGEMDYNRYATDKQKLICMALFSGKTQDPLNFSITPRFALAILDNDLDKPLAWVIDTLTDHCFLLRTEYDDYLDPQEACLQRESWAAWDFEQVQWIEGPKLTLTPNEFETKMVPFHDPHFSIFPYNGIFLKSCHTAIFKACDNLDLKELKTLCGHSKYFEHYKIVSHSQKENIISYLPLELWKDVFKMLFALK